MTEHRDTSLWENSLLEFINRVSASSATPGGGAVAAVTATFAAALLQMVCVLSSRRKPNAGMNTIAAKVKSCGEQLAHYADEDIRVFDQYMAAKKIRGGSAHAEVQACLLACAAVPLAAAELVAKLQADAAEMVPNTPEFLLSDLATARHLLHASRKALLANVSVNLSDLEEGEAKGALVRRLEALQGEATSAG